jgi:DNA-binding MarR family transcriptional regulator
MDDVTTTAPSHRPDFESGVGSAERMELRVWLRLLTCCNLIEGRIRQKLGQSFETTLPRFDILAQLERAGAPISMSELSRRMMVTNGNITGLVERLAAEGLVGRTAAAKDRRVQMVTLTVDGRRAFAKMAEEHRSWLASMMTGLDRKDMAELHAMLSKLKQSVLDHGGQAENSR